MRQRDEQVDEMNRQSSCDNSAKVDGKVSIEAKRNCEINGRTGIWIAIRKLIALQQTQKNVKKLSEAIACYFALFRSTPVDV